MARPREQLPDQPPHRRGIVRRAVRPAGYQAPGPKPAGPGGRDELWPDAGEDLCYLLGDFRIFQRLDGHRWSLDDLVTAWVAKRALASRPVDRAFDLGCGIGSVLLMTTFLWPQARCVGVEAQALSIGLARRSAAYNGVEPRVCLRHGDLRDPAMTGDGPIFDLVTGTPPYFDTAAGTVSDRPQKGPCRFELRGGLEAYCQAAARLLAADGRFVLCVSQLAPARVEAVAAELDFCLYHRLDVIGRVGKDPLIHVYTLGYGDCADTPVEELVVRDQDGRWTPAFRALRQAMALPV